MNSLVRSIPRSYPENTADQERMNFGQPKCTQAVQQGDESDNDEEREAQDSEDMFSDA